MGGVAAECYLRLDGKAQLFRSARRRIRRGIGEKRKGLQIFAICKPYLCCYVLNSLGHDPN